MKFSLCCLASSCAVIAGGLFAADTPAPAPKAPATPAATAPAQADKPVRKITPGQVIVPTEAMRRIWGELISIDFKNRTGKFRKDGTDEVMDFKVLPYAELLHHAAFGDLQDFRPGVRAIFRMHQNDAGEWVWLTYIQDQMNMMNGHGEYFFVDEIDGEHQKFICTQAKFDKSFIREKGIPIETDKDTVYWKNGQPAKFSDIHVGDKIRTETHGLGKGKTQMCWQIFLDDESLQKSQNEQKAIHVERMHREGLPGYVDASADKNLDLSLFWEALEFSKTLKPGQKVRVAPAGADRQPNGPVVTGSVTSAKMAGPICKVSVTLDAPASLPVGQVARLWTEK